MRNKYNHQLILSLLRKDVTTSEISETTGATVQIIGYIKRQNGLATAREDLVPIPEIASHLNISQSEVRRCLKSSLEKLRVVFNDKNLIYSDLA